MYVAALIREGDDFDPSAWFRKIREKRAQAKHVSATITSGEAATSEIENLTDTPNGPNACSKSELALINKTPPAIARSDQKATSQTPEVRLRRRLSKICDAFDEFHESRGRDAVYGYLEAVYGIVVHYKVRRRTQSFCDVH